MIEKICERLEVRRLEYEKASESVGLELPQETYYKGIMRGYEYSKDVVQEVAKEYSNTSNNDLAVVSALPSLYQLKPFEEEAIHKVVASAKDGVWIPAESGQLPKHLVNVWVTVKTENGYCYVTESFYDLNFGKWRIGKLCEVIAWQEKQMPPVPYQKVEQKKAYDEEKCKDRKIFASCADGYCSDNCEMQCPYQKGE